MPSAQNGDAKAGAQLNPYNGGDQRKKNTNGGNANSNKSISNSNNNSHYSQQSKQSNRRMGQPTIGGATSSSDHYHHRTGSSGVSSVPQPTPLFERLVTEEVQELKAYARIIENQNRRLVELERIHGDLENRLELEARERTQLEADLEQRERGWSMKYHKLEKDRDQWKEFVSQEQAKNTRLIDQVVRKDKDIHRMLQRKYDNNNNKRESGPGQPIRNSSMWHNERQSQGNSPSQTRHGQEPLQQRMEVNKSPHEILATTGSIETIRIRNVKTLLTDFFAL